MGGGGGGRCCVSLHEVLLKLVKWRLEVNTCCSLKTTVSPKNSTSTSRSRIGAPIGDKLKLTEIIN